MADIHFHVPFQGQIDDTRSTIRGVSLITGDLEAEGHALQVDNETLQQMYSLAKGRGKVPVKMDHKGSDGKTFKAIVGYLTNFRVDSSKVRGDLELLEAEPATPKILEMARRMPECFGLSVAFKGEGKKGGAGKMCARATKLLSVDLVEQPAANPDGLFAARVDTHDFVMNPAQTQQTTADQPSLADLLSAVTSFGDRLGAIEASIATLQQQDPDADADSPDLEQLASMSDEELASVGLTRQEVNDAIQSYLNDSDPNADADQGTDDAANTNAASSATATAGSVGAALSALQNQVTQLSAERDNERRLARESEVEYAFSVIEAKTDELIEQHRQALVQLAAKDEEIRTLRFASRNASGARPGPAREVLFSASNPAQGTFEAIVQAKAIELKAQGFDEAKAKSKAIDFGVNRHTEAFQEYRSRGGKLDIKF